jgi:cytochrome c oxidase subunit II
MTGKKAWPFILGGAVLWGVLLDRMLAAAKLMPAQASLEAKDVDHAFHVMTVLSVVFYAAITAYIAYCLFRFRAKDPSEQGAPFDRSRGRRVEIAWISLSFVITLGLAAFGSQELHEIFGDQRADLDVQVGASQFSWEFYYPAQDQYGSRLVLPRGKRVRFLLSSKDVIHSFWVPEFRLKQDALPGRTIPLYLTPTVAGTYQLRCSELCGSDHTEMTAWVDVVEPEEFEGKIKGEAW